VIHTKKKGISMKTITTIRYLLAGLMLTLLMVGCANAPRLPTDTTSTVIMLRHAERTQITKELTEAGSARAQALPGALQDLSIAAIYSPNLKRNIDTAMPLSKQLGIDITLIEQGKSWESVANRLVSEHPGKSVLWVGNRGNLIQLYALLGGKGEPPLEYGEIVILHVSGGQQTEEERRHFGNLFYN
jgi:hypothetical protein